MSQRLIAGQNCNIPQDVVQVVVTTGAEADVSAFRLYKTGKIRQDSDFIFYGQCTDGEGTITLTPRGTVVTFDVDLQHMHADVEKIAFSVTSDAPNLLAVRQIGVEVLQAGTSLLECTVDLAGRKEAALILGEIYRRNGTWKFRFVAQGFEGGLKPLAEFFGVEIAAEAVPPPAPAQPVQAPTVNLSKVTLTKEKPRVDLKKKDVQGGVFKVNLNWNQQPQPVEKPQKGFWDNLLGAGKSSSGIDLDLAAYIELQNGHRTIVQALGDFGALQAPPYVQLLGDDRTGASSDGEWIHINGQKFDQIKEVLIFTFIYEGVPRWSDTDAVITIYIPGQPEIQTHLTEGNNKLGLCAIARISNVHSDVSITRINRYFSGHRDADVAFGWGFEWVKGHK